MRSVCPQIRLGGGVGGLCKFTLASGMQPPDCTYLQLLPDGSDCALMCMILTPGSSCTSGLFDDVNGVDTVIDTTACTTPKTAENNADTPDTVFALTQPGVTKADCEIDAVHAGASALVAAVRAGHISPTIRTTRRLVSKVTSPRRPRRGIVSFSFALPESTRGFALSVSIRGCIYERQERSPVCQGPDNDTV